MRRKEGLMDWARYAQYYDLMCSLNPAYLDNIELLRNVMRRYPVPEGARICDIGAGTGNYIKAISQSNKEYCFQYIDPSEDMLKIARQKLSSIKGLRVDFQLGSAENCDLPIARFDLILCINSLYAMNDPICALRRIREALSPDGYAFVLDFGRVQNTLDWSAFLLFESMKAGRLREYFRSLWVGREVLRQNHLTRVGQLSGNYWLHSTKEFGAILEKSGFNVRELGSCYRSYCDYAVINRAADR